MKRNRRVFYVIFALILVVSCNGNNGKKVVSTDFLKKEKTKNKTAVIQQSPRTVDIWEVSEKMSKQEKLKEADYDCICNFLLKEESVEGGEGIGYRLFEYLKNKPLNNRAFVSYLSRKEDSQKEKFLTALIQIMCIDIGEENYSYDTFIKDFNMFSNSSSAKKAFNECMSNQ